MDFIPRVTHHMVKQQTRRTLIIENATAALISTIAVFCSELHFTLILPVYVVLVLSARSYVLSVFSLPLTYIALFHPGIPLDIFELLSGEGSLHSKLALIKIAFVHTTPLSYWMGLTGELVLLYICALGFSYFLKKNKKTSHSTHHVKIH